MWMKRQAAGGAIGPNVSISGSSARSGASSSAAGRLVAEVGAVDRDEGAAAQELGDVRQRRDLEQAGDWW